MDNGHWALDIENRILDNGQRTWDIKHWTLKIGNCKIGRRMDNKHWTIDNGQYTRQFSGEWILDSRQWTICIGQ